jgi:2-dehydropantoate 2-reductase
VSRHRGHTQRYLAQTVGEPQYHPLTGETSDVIINDPLVYELCVHMMQEAAARGEAIDIPMTISTTEMIGQTKSLGAFKTSML